MVAAHQKERKYEQCVSQQENRAIASKTLDAAVNLNKQLITSSQYFI